MFACLLSQSVSVEISSYSTCILTITAPIKRWYMQSSPSLTLSTPRCSYFVSLWEDSMNIFIGNKKLCFIYCQILEQPWVTSFTAFDEQVDYLIKIDLHSRHKFPLVESVLSTNTVQLATPTAVVPLLHKCTSVSLLGMESCLNPELLNWLDWVAGQEAQEPIYFCPLPSSSQPLVIDYVHAPPRLVFKWVLVIWTQVLRFESQSLSPATSSPSPLLFSRQISINFAQMVMNA